LVLTQELAPAAPSPATLTVLTHQPAVSSVAVGEGSGWLTDDRTDTLVRFDPSTGRRLGPSLSVPGRPVDVVTAAGHVWVASMLTNTVEEIAPDHLRLVRTLPVPSGPVGMAWDGGLLWVASVLAGDVTAIDPYDGRIVATSHIASGAVRIAAGGSSVWVTGSTDTVAEVSPRPAGGRLHWRTIVVGRSPLGVAAGPRAVWVADAGAGTVTEIDPATGRVVGTYRTGPDPVAVAPMPGTEGATAWVADGQADDVRAVGAGAGSGGVGPVAHLGGTPRQMVVAGAAVWTAIGNPGTVVSVQGG
jgi:hypothetical protein